MSGLIGRKIGMSSLFDEKGKNVPCTVLELGPCVVTQVKTIDNDGYEAVQLGFDDKPDKKVNKKNSISRLQHTESMIPLSPVLV